MEGKEGHQVAEGRVSAADCTAVQGDVSNSGAPLAHGVHERMPDVNNEDYAWLGPIVPDLVHEAVVEGEDAVLLPVPRCTAGDHGRLGRLGDVQPEVQPQPRVRRARVLRDVGARLEDRELATPPGVRGGLGESAQDARRGGERREDALVGAPLVVEHDLVPPLHVIHRHVPTIVPRGTPLEPPQHLLTNLHSPRLERLHGAQGRRVDVASGLLGVEPWRRRCEARHEVERGLVAVLGLARGDGEVGQP